MSTRVSKHINLPGAGVPKEKPLAGFWAKRLPPPNKLAEVVVVAAAGVAVTPPRPPNANPAVLAAGALKYTDTERIYSYYFLHGNSNHITNKTVFT